MSLITIREIFSNTKMTNKFFGRSIDMNTTPNPEINTEMVTQKKKNTYTLTHGIYALLTFILGSLWYRWFFNVRYDSIFWDYPALGIFSFSLVFFALTLSFFKFRKKRLGKDAIIILCATLIYCIRFVIYPEDTQTAASLAIFTVHICALLFLYCIGRDNALDRIVETMVKCVFYTPFAYFHTIFASFTAFFKFKAPSSEEQKDKSKKLLTNISLWVITIFACVPIVSIVVSLLFSDGFFSDFLGSIKGFFSQFSFDFRIDDYFNFITVLVSMYIFGAIYGAENSKKDAPSTFGTNAMFPKIIGQTVLVVLIAIYALFVLAQIDGFAHMFMGVLPEGLTYAEFARSGFFELCTVACINGAVLYILDLLIVKEGERITSLTAKIVLILFTLLLIGTAVAKMLMYISAYGFTINRFIALWFMLLLTVLFVLTAVKLRRAEFKLSRYSVYVSLAFLAVLFFVDFEGVSEMLNNAYFN